MLKFTTDVKKIDENIITINNKNMNDKWAKLYDNYKNDLNIANSNDNNNHNDIEIYHCYDCKTSDSIKNIGGTMICIDCGLIKGTDINDEFECQYSGMASNDNGIPSRTGLTNNNLLFQSNFTTKIIGYKSSYNIRQINNVWDNMIHKERTLFKIFKDITEKCKQNGIPNNVINYSHVLYKTVSEKQKELKKGGKGSRADKLKGLIAACIYYSCKSHNINRSHNEIAEICDTSKTNVSTGCKLFFKLMNNEININKNVTTYNDFLERYGSHLHMTTEELQIVREICENVSNLDLLGDNKPWTIATICIHLASVLYDFDINIKDITENCESTDATIKKFYPILLNNINDIIV